MTDKYIVHKNEGHNPTYFRVIEELQDEYMIIQTMPYSQDSKHPRRNIQLKTYVPKHNYIILDSITEFDD